MSETLSVGATARTPIRADLRRARLRRGAVGWAFLAPLVVLNLLVILIPSLQSVYYSFTDWTGIGTSAEFTGFDNYVRFVTDPELGNALRNNAFYLVFFLTVPIAMGLFGAYALTRVKRFRTLFRISYLIPYMLASVVNAVVWRSLLSPDFGIGKLLGINFLGNKNTALSAVAFVDNWHWWGFIVIIFFAAMQGVNPSLLEAASLDGANHWNQFWHIVLPGIRPTVSFFVLMTILWSFLSFDYVYILTRGGPAGSSDLLAVKLYRVAFSDLEAGYASAIGVVMGLVTILVFAGYLYLRKRNDWEI